MQANALKQIYQDTIENSLGLVTRIDDDGDVRFRHPEYGHFFIRLDADSDPEYLCIVYPSFLTEESTSLSVPEILSVLNHVNRTSKAAQAYLLEHEGGFRVSACACGYFAGTDQAPSPDLLEAVLPRYLAALHHVARRVQQACKDAMQMH